MAKNIKKNQKEASLLGVDFSGTTVSGVIETLEKRLSSNKKTFIVTPNPEILVNANNDQTLKKILNSAEISIPDGFGITMFLKALYGIKINRIQGRILAVSLMEKARDKKLKLFVLGGSKNVISATLKRAKKDYPGILINGAAGPKLNANADPFSELDIEKNIEAINQINKFKTDILFIALGSPKQEKWWEKNKNKLNVDVAMVVGGTFDTYSGNIAEVPQVMSDAGLEWMWRLIQEPRRIGRIFNAVVVFSFLVIKEKFSLL